MNKDELKERLNHAGIEFDDFQCDKLRLYMEHILKKNEFINLTAITEEKEFVEKHYIDSLMCKDFEEMQSAKCIIDVGTGGGFPGVPLAVAFPEKNFVLLDSLNKRLKVIEEITKFLGIENVSVLHGRAEDVGQSEEHREKYDICVSRAVANLTTLAELCLPLVKVGGYFLPYKTSNNTSEIAEGERAIKLMGAVPMEERPFTNSKFEFNRNILVIKKREKTPKKYPRKAGTPAKSPIK